MYRVLCIGEFYKRDIYLKDFNLKVRLEEYVLCGSFFIKLWFVLCCKILDGVYEMVIYIN